MSKGIKYFIVFFQLLAVLVFSGGVELYKMICLSSGNVESSVYVPVDCDMGDENNSNIAFLNAKCCEFESFLLDLDDFQVVSSQLISPAIISTITTLSFSFKEFASEHYMVFRDASPPPLSGRQIIHLISRLTI